MVKKTCPPLLTLEESKTNPAPGKIYFRAALFVVIAGWMLWGPFYRQVLHGKSDVFREWRMYGTRSLKSCRVEYFTLETETRVPFSRMAALKLKYGSKSWQRQRHLRRKSEAKSEGQALCQRFSLDELYFSMRCGELHDGWKNIVKKSGNLCTIANAE